MWGDEFDGEEYAMVFGSEGTCESSLRPSAGEVVCEVVLVGICDRYIVQRSSVRGAIIDL
jgi:hypothetical protein